ncbi:hypothetical protein GCM10023319_73420 [Nocardia iowensis]
MIWAGVPYDAAGNVVGNLDRYRKTPMDHKRPLQIIHTGPRPDHVEPPVAPQRQLILGRPLRPTGTGGD